MSDRGMNFGIIGKQKNPAAFFAGGVFGESLCTGGGGDALAGALTG